VSTAYTSTVVARGHLLAGVLLGALGPVASLAGLIPWPAGLAIAVVLVAAGAWLGTVRLAVGPRDLRVALGPWGRSRRIGFDDVRSATVADLGPGQVVGIGLPWRARTTRLTVRRGPTLVVERTDGEVLYVSTPDPGAAARLIGHAGVRRGEEPS
jgi:hypothetical protein